jgi:glycosyltransferase involved in cell wall biosynthesis
MQGTGSGPEISVVVPAYNEVENIPVLLAEIEAALTGAGKSYEIVIVDDGSTDGTGEAVRQIAARDARIRAIYFDGNFGQSSGFDAGIKAARGAAIVTIDADLQNDPADIPKLAAQLVRYDAAVGWRARRKDTWTKKLTSRFANRMRNWATGETIHDTGCSLKAFRREALANVKLFNGMHRFLPTLVKMEGFTVTEVEVNHRPRRFGKSKYSIFNRFLRPTMDLLAVMWMQRRHLRYRIRKQG